MNLEAKLLMKADFDDERRDSRGICKMTTRHYVVQTTDPSIATTKIAVAELTDIGFVTTWLATREPYTDRHRKTRMLEASLFPGYLFVEFDMADDLWKHIPQQRGVRRILGTALRPAPLPLRSVDHLKAQFEAGEFKPKPARQIQIDDRLHVDAGPFAGHIGVCRMSRGERVKVMLKILGDEREIEMWSGLVRRAAE